MRVLINVNEQVSAMMIEKHFQASSLAAEVTSAPKNMMLEIMRACKIDLVAFYAEDVDNAALISFFNAAGNSRKILFIKKQNLNQVSEALESLLNECFTIPIDSGELMIRLRRMFRPAEQQTAPPQMPPQEIKPPEQIPVQPFQYYPPVQSAVPPQAFARPEMTYQPQVNPGVPQPETTPAYRDAYTVPINSQPFQYPSPVQSAVPPQAFIRPEMTYQPQVNPGVPQPETTPAYRDAYTVPINSQPFQYPPPVQSAVPPQAFARPEMTYQPQVNSRAPQPETAPAYRDPYTAPINTGYSNTPENVRQETAYKIVPEPAVPPAQKAKAEKVKVKKEKTKKERASAVNDEARKGKSKKNKSPLRYLNKTELLEIILEQEKILNSLDTEMAEVKQKLDEREIVLEEAGSIAQAALQLNGVFDAAQKSADQYLDSVKVIGGYPGTIKEKCGGKS